MKVTYQPDQEFTPAAAQSATGKTIDAWFAELDAQGGVAAGRRALSDYLFKDKKVDAWWTTTLVVEHEKARGAVEKDGQAKGYNICVTKSVAAPPQKIYDALLDMKAWLGAQANLDLREGGAFDDGEGHRGVFKRLAPGKTIRFTWEGKGHQKAEDVEIKFTVAGAKTSIVLNHNRLPDRAAADGMRAAWTRVLDSIKEKVA
jgi:uncharacterized protein YndB with AHSA1/START domain